MDATKNNNPQNDNNNNQEFSLNDDRRVKVLSPGALVAKRFFRNRIAVVGLVMLIIMFIFSFIGGLISPYGQDEQFYRYEDQDKEFAGVSENVEFRYTSAEGQDFNTILQAQFILATNNDKESFDYKDVTYDLEKIGDEFYIISSNGTELAIASKDIINAEVDNIPYEVRREALRQYSLLHSDGSTESFVPGEAEDSEAETEAEAIIPVGPGPVIADGKFSAGGADYELDESGNIITDGNVIGYISRFVVSPIGDTVLSRDFKEALEESIYADEKEFTFTDENGEEQVYDISYNPNAKVWSVLQAKSTYVYDSYSEPSLKHPLGTDLNGMDMITRLMYGGRVSLMIGFIVVIISAVLGVILGGISGYFGGWVDQLIMRIVDIFYCIPSLPLIIILGSAMDAMRVDPGLRMVYLMLILGVLGWSGIARMVRGQILSLREQEFMAAAEAGGIRASRRIFRHLIPNVIPQLIVICTMSLGSTIITEATLSFLGLGVKFPFASWGNIISDVNNVFVMTHYWFIWIPAGICLLVTVLGFNFVGDGLRDAFDPRMNR